MTYELHIYFPSGAEKVNEYDALCNAKEDQWEYEKEGCITKIVER